VGLKAGLERLALRTSSPIPQAMTDSALDQALARALARLRDPGGPHLARGVALAVDAGLDRPLREVLLPERVVALTILAVDETRIERALREIVHPAQDRQRAWLETQDQTLAAWLPGDAAALLEEIAAGTRTPRGTWAAKLVDRAHVRELLAPVLQETLLAFARKLPMASSVEEGRAGKLLGGLARGIAQGAGERAAKLADLGRNALGSIGAEMEKRVVSAARDFSQGAVEPLRDAFAERLTSEEGRAILARMRAHAIGVLLEAKAAELVDDLDSAPRAPLDRLVARTLAHDVRRPEVQEMLRAEVESFLAAREGVTLRALLDEWGMTAEVVTDARRITEVVARAAVADDAFEAWLRDLLAE
jgi:hypothetical protein